MVVVDSLVDALLRGFISLFEKYRFFDFQIPQVFGTIAP